MTIININNNIIKLDVLLRAYKDYVYLGSHNGAQCIIKFINNITDDLPNEIYAMKHAYNNHINVPKILSVYKGTFSLQSEDEGSTEVEKFAYMIIMEYIQDGKDIRSLVNLEFPEKIKIAREMVNIIEKLHDNNIIHNDIKSDNFLYASNKLYIIDFGMSYCANYAMTCKYPPPVVSLEDAIYDPLQITIKYDIKNLIKCLNILFNCKIPDLSSTKEISNYFNDLE